MRRNLTDWAFVTLTVAALALFVNCVTGARYTHELVARTFDYLVFVYPVLFVVTIGVLAAGKAISASYWTESSFVRRVLIVVSTCAFLLDTALLLFWWWFWSNFKMT